MLYCFDTSLIVSALRARSERLQARFAAVPPAECCISEIARAELIVGALKTQ